jgi:aspartate kinase
MTTRPGVAGVMFRALAEKQINVQMITTSQIKISVVVARKSARQALLAVHEAFALQIPPAIGSTAGRSDDRTAAKPAPDPFKLAARLVARLQRMEKLIIEGIDLDESQSRVTFGGLHDTPGVAAAMFDKLAEAGIVVDMIVQSAGRGKRSDITVTVPAADLERTVAVRATFPFAAAPPSSAARVAKLSVHGVGMKSHTGVAARIFRSLASAAIPIAMVSTSEACVNVVVDGAAGQNALATLQSEFADSIL